MAIHCIGLSLRSQGCRAERVGEGVGKRTVNLAEAPVPAKIWYSGVQLEMEGGPMRGQVLICGTQEEARALVWFTAQAARWRRSQCRGMVVDFQDLNGQGACGCARRNGWKKGELISSSSTHKLPCQPST